MAGQQVPPAKWWWTSISKVGLHGLGGGATGGRSGWASSFAKCARCRPGDWCGDRVGDAAGADAACGVPASESGTRVIGAVQEGADGIARTTFAAWAAGDPAIGAYGSVL